MSAIVSAFLMLLTQLLPLVSQGGAVGTVINVLLQIVPTLLQEAQDLAPLVKNIIAVLKNDPATTQDQFNQLDSLDQQIDAAFEAAANAATAADTPTK